MSAAFTFGCASSGGGGGSGQGGSSNSGGSNGSGSGGSNNNTGGDNGTGTGGSNSAGGSTSTGGSSARGGNTGSGGVVTTGGTIGSGGSHTGGATGSGGSNTGGSGQSGSCTVSGVSATPSPKIGTVGIVTFSTSLSSPSSGHIDFGLDTTYGMQAPIDFTQANNRTLLLGMKASKTYHYNVTVSDGSNTCSSGDQTIKTNPLPNGGLPQLKVTTNNKAALYGGFLVTGSYSGSTIQSFILDADGDFVWWYSDGADGCGTRMSYDGKYMWINNGNVPATNGSTHVHRVTMDGMTDTDFSTPFANMSHQLTPLPDGSIAFYASGANQCDDVKIFPANGTPSSTATTVTNAHTAHGGTGACHLNNIEYDASDDSLVFSDLDNVCLTKVSRTTGATIWILAGTNGITSTFTGDLWSGGEHGFHIISPTDYLIFNNNSAASNTSPAIALELTLDVAGKKSTKKWSYTSNPGIHVQVLGDVQRMTANGPNGAGNGNTIVDYGTGDVIEEVDSNGTVLQQISSNFPFGFMEKRPTLYGKPTK